MTDEQLLGRLDMAAKKLDGFSAADILRYMYGHPYYITVIYTAIVWEKEKRRPFKWSDVRVFPRDLNRLVIDGILTKDGNRGYVLRDHESTASAYGQYMLERAQAMLRMQLYRNGSSETPMPPGVPQDIFSDIVGYDDVKKEIILALNAKTNVHVLLMGPPSCLVADERILIGNGSMTRIGDMGREHLQPIDWTVQTGQGHRRAKAERFHAYSNQPIMELITETGKSVRGTYNQPILCRANRQYVWKRMDELVPGDRVVVVGKIQTNIKNPPSTGFTLPPRKYGPHFRGRLPTEVTDELALLSGYMIGDGWAETNGYRSGMIVNLSENDIVETLTEAISTQFGVEPAIEKREPDSRHDHIVNGKTFHAREPVWYIVIRSQAVTYNLGFVAEKRVPDFIFRSPDRTVAIFLRWLFEADGYVRNRKNGGFGRRAGEIALVSMNVELLRDVQMLLLRFGIKARVNQGKDRNRLTIAVAQDIARYCEHIGFASAKKQQRAASVMIRASRISTHSVRHRSERIVSVQPAGRADVFDIEVPDGNRFVANGIVVHNTAKSLFLEGLRGLPGARLTYGDAVSKAGLRHFVMEEHPQYLIIDEIDKMDSKDDTILLELMEHQTVSVMHYNENEMEDISLKVFAAANVTKKMRPELLSRFHKILLREYTVEEFMRVAYQHLVLKLGADEQIAQYIARGVAVKSRDIRDAIRIANMSRTLDDAQFLVMKLGHEADV